MGVVLALLAAVGYGTSDFVAGLASRRYAAEAASVVGMAVGLGCTLVALTFDAGVGPRVGALAWGAAAGLGEGLGTLALYRGFANGQFAVVGTLSGVVSAVVPALIGLAGGDALGTPAAVGIVVAIPAIALVSWHPDPDRRGAARPAVVHGLLAGLAFALLFVALDRAHTRSGAWPLVGAQVVATALIAPFGARAYARLGAPATREVAMLLAAGTLAGTANLLFLAATGHGELAIVAVVTALYPGFTVLLARGFLGERWAPTQAAGLLVAAAAIVLVSVG